MFKSNQTRVIVVSGGAERWGFKLGVEKLPSDRKKLRHIVLDFSGLTEQFLEDIGMTRVHGQSLPVEYHFLATPFQGDQCRMFLRVKTLTDLGATYELQEENLETGSGGFVGKQEMRDWAPFKDHLFTEAGKHFFDDAIRTILFPPAGNALGRWQQILGNFCSANEEGGLLSSSETIMSYSSEVRTLDVISRIHRLPLDVQEVIFGEVYGQLATKLTEIADMSGALRGKLYTVYKLKFNMNVENDYFKR